MSNQPPPIRIADALATLLPAVKVTLVESERLIQISAPSDTTTEQNIASLIPVAKSLLDSGWQVVVVGAKLAPPAAPGAQGHGHEQGHGAPETD